LISSKNKIADDPKQLPERISKLPRPLVFTNGCFDILHRGHIDYLEQAAYFGASLIVAVNTDASVRRLEKGMDRPINTLEDRMAILAALACVSLVIPFDGDTPLDLIKLIRPDHLVKGGDWAPQNIVGSAEVRAYGGQVHSIPFRFDRSTTQLIERINRRGKP